MNHVDVQEYLEHWSEDYLLWKKILQTINSTTTHSQNGWMDKHVEI